MQKYANNVQDTFGNAIASVTVTIRDNPGGGLSTIYSDDGVTGKANPFTNDSDGELFFYAANGRYDVELTGPITETKDDVLLDDPAAAQIKIVADIVTATPPAAETPEAFIDFVDLDDTDRLAQVGFLSSNVFYAAYNQMHGSEVRLSGQNAAGTFTNLFNADPDGGATLYHAGLRIFGTHDRGHHLYSTTASAPWMGFYSDLNARQGFIQFGSADSTITSEVHGVPFLLEAEDTGGVVKTLFNADPDGDAVIYYAGDDKLRVSLADVAIYKPDDLDATQLRYRFRNNSGANQALLGFNGNTNLSLRNEIHGGNILLEGDDAGGTVRTFLNADPDGVTRLAGDTNLELYVNANTEAALVAVANLEVGLYYNGNVKFKTVDQTAADNITGAEIKNASGNFKPAGLGVIEDDGTSFGSGTQNPFQQINAHESVKHTNASSAQYTTYASTGASQTNIPAGAQWEVKNDGVGVLTILGGTSVTLYHWAGAGATPPTGTRTLARGGIATVRKISDTRYEIWGNGLT